MPDEPRYEPRYPEAIGYFRGADKRLEDSPILAIISGDWDGAGEVFDAARLGELTGATDWAGGANENGISHAVLSFSSLQPPTHIVLAFSLSEPEHRRALEAAATTGYIVITTLNYFNVMPEEGVPWDTSDVPVIAVAVDPGRILPFLRAP